MAEILQFPRKPKIAAPRDNLPMAKDVLEFYLAYYVKLGQARKADGIVMYSTEDLTAIRILQDVFEALNGDGWGVK